MEALIKRVKEATGPDRELDAEIAAFVQHEPPGFDRAVFLPSVEIRFVAREDGEVFIYAEMPNDDRQEYLRVSRRYFAPHYTASLDAALSLVPEHGATLNDDGMCAWRIVGNWPYEAPEAFSFSASVVMAKNGLEAGTFEGRSRTPALALVLASLRARLAMGE